MSATDYQRTQVEEQRIELGPRFPTDEERAIAMTGLLDVEEFLIEPFANCVFELLNEDELPTVSYEEIGRLGCDVEDLRDPLRRMLAKLDRLDAVRDELGRLARGEDPDADASRFDRHGQLKRRPIDAYGHEIPWEVTS